MKILNPKVSNGLPSCVLLDLDNTLYAYDTANKAGMIAVVDYAETQLRIKAADFDNCFDDARTEIKQRLGASAASHNRLLYFQRTLEKAGLATQPLAALQLEQIYWSAFLAAAELFDEVPEFLDDLRIAGVPVVIVTDLTAQIQLRKVLYFGLHRLVDWVVTSEEAGTDKPAPTIFHLALAKIGGVEGTVWMIGDDPVKDMKGARDSLSCMTFLKLGTYNSALASGDNIDVQFQSFSELRKLLAGFPR